MTATVVSDIQKPEKWNAYLSRRTKVLSVLVRSGLLKEDPALVEFLAGGGLIGNMPHWRDLADDAANIAINTVGSAITVKPITSDKEKIVRLSRNQGWGGTALARILAGADPLAEINTKVPEYWVLSLIHI